MNAIADEDVIESKLITGLSVEANAAAEQGSHTTGELQPREIRDAYLNVEQAWLKLAPDIHSGRTFSDKLRYP